MRVVTNALEWLALRHALAGVVTVDVTSWVWRAGQGAALAAACVVVLAGCGPDHPIVQAGITGGGTLYLDAAYLVTTASINVYGVADVGDQTAGTLTLSGPVSATCHGIFRTHPPLGGGPSFQDAPWFAVPANDPSGRSSLLFTGPSGTYTVTLALDDGKARASTTIQAGLMTKDAHGNWAVPKGCLSGTGATPSGA